MTAKVITSRDNQLVRRARAVRDGRVRELIFIEGLRLSEEAARAALPIEVVLCTEKFLHDKRGSRLREDLNRLSDQVGIVSPQVISSISDTKTPQGIILLASRPGTSGDGGWGLGVRERNSLSSPQPLTPIPHPPLIVILHRISNPLNAGAIVRTAEAAGATGAIFTEGSTDPFSPKALRGSMGSSFRLPLWTGVKYKDALAWCRRRGIRTVCADISASRSHTEIDWSGPRALIVGSEAAGLLPEEIMMADEALRIPMRQPVESLNVAVATSIILYEAARQRGQENTEGERLRGKG